MCGRALASSHGESANLILERLEGELDAAIVFAAAAEDADRNGQAGLARACRADARETYAAVVAGLSEPPLTESQRESLRPKLVRVRELLARPRRRSSAKNEAA